MRVVAAPDDAPEGIALAGVVCMVMTPPVTPAVALIGAVVTTTGEV